MEQSVPDMSAFYLRDGIKFYEHQRYGIKWMSRRRHMIQGDDMGLGKTLQTLVTFCKDLHDKRAGSESAIVVCPNSVVGNWAEEINKFTLIPSVVLGERSGRKSRLTPFERQIQIAEFAGMTGPRIMICSYETLVAHVKLLGALKFHMGIFDEAHKLQNPASKRTKACIEFVEYVTRVLALTGTPMLNEVGNLWALLWMTGAERRGPDTFLNRYAVMQKRTITVRRQVGQPGDENYKPAVTKKEKKVVGVKRESELKMKLYGDKDLQHLIRTDPAYYRRAQEDRDFRVKAYGMMIRRLKEDVLDLPPVHKIPVYVDMSEKQRDLYMQAVNEMIIEMPDGVDDIEVDNSFVKFAKLKQICGSTFAFTGEDDSAKLDRATEIIEELIRGNDDRKVVVFTQFRDINDLFTARLREGLGINAWQLHGDVPRQDRTGLIREWGEAKGPGVIVAGLQVTAEGLNMTQARHAIFLDKLFVPKLNDQAIDRLNRIGQQTVHPVTVYEMITRHSVELRVDEICDHKRDLFEAVVEDEKALGLMRQDLLKQVQELAKAGA